MENMDNTTEKKSKKKAADEPQNPEVSTDKETQEKQKKKSVKKAAKQTKSAVKKPAKAKKTKKGEIGTDKNILLVVESPAKSKTIEKYLGKGYTVTASIGHLFDLPRSRLAIDVDNNFEPEYITIRGKAKILKELLKYAKKADQILLASDNDREGEAISFHIRNAILKKFPDMNIKRIVFNEITPSAIRKAIEEPSEIDMKKVNAQKARRILDRLVGYKLSPILWKKVKNGLSAGRVQSVALRLICERDKAVDEFLPEEYWTIDAEFKKGKKGFTGSLVKYEDRKPQITSEKTAQEIVAKLEGGEFKVADVKTREKISRPLPPFTTSKLQQAAANRFGFTSRKTMRIAQQLYEGVEIGSNPVGLVTYIRTDSTRVADSALTAAREYIAAEFPAGLPEQPNIYTAGKKAQDAHEAIRPTYVEQTPEKIKKYLTSEQFRLYAIIWERFVSSQMKPAVNLTTTVDLENGAALFRVSASRVTDKGFQEVLKFLASKDKITVLPKLETGDTVDCTGYLPLQHFTSGPAHYTDASIIKALEENGIGRPSTYAPIISVLQDRYYVVRKSKKLQATVLGKIINEILQKTFPEIINVQFTAEMESRLDNVEENTEDWISMLKVFYSPFQQQVDHVMDNLESIKGVLDEPTDYTCEKCGKPLVKKLGRFGFFLACTGFPECMNSKPVPLADCPREGCGGKIVAKRSQGRRGKIFYGCTNYPSCDFISYFPPTNAKCPECGYFLVEKEDKKRGEYKVCPNPECGYLHIRKEGDKSA